MFRLLAVFASIFFSAAFLCGCDSVVCDVSDVQATVVFDFRDSETQAQTRACVFVQTSGDVSRTDSILVQREDGDERWRVENPVLLSSSSGEWAGSANIRGEAGLAIPEGNYRIFYKNASGDEAEAEFSVWYPDGMENCTASDVLSRLESGSFSEKIAVYDRNLVLIFFGKLEKNDAASVLKKFPDGAFMRLCYQDNSKKYAVFMPPVSLLSN